MTFLLEAKLESLKECHKGADDSVGSTTVLLYLSGCMGPLTRSRLLKQYNLMSNKHWSYWKECPFCVITRYHRPVVSTPFNNLNLQFLYRLTELAWRATNFKYVIPVCFTNTYNFYFQSYTPIYYTIQLYLWARCFDCFQSSSGPTTSKSKALLLVGPDDDWKQSKHVAQRYSCIV
jgi:hypothetical protein